MNGKNLMHYYAKATHYNDEHGKYVVLEFPELQGMAPTGDTLEEALADATEQLDIWLADSLERNLAIPAPKEHKGKDYLAVQVNPQTTAAILMRDIRGDRSVTEMAKVIGASPESYYRLETAQANPTLSMLDRVARAFGKRLEVQFV
jgi:antitoxin HicB